MKFNIGDKVRVLDCRYENEPVIGYVKESKESFYSGNAYYIIDVGCGVGEWGSYPEDLELLEPIERFEGEIEFSI